ncbi:hypothetical protein OIU77_001968, partial [Salix suchowensis]
MSFVFSGLHLSVLCGGCWVDLCHL